MGIRVTSRPWIEESSHWVVQIPRTWESSDPIWSDHERSRWGEHHLCQSISSLNEIKEGTDVEVKKDDYSGMAVCISSKESIHAFPCSIWCCIWIEIFVLAQARSVSQNAAEISQRKSKLETITQEVGSAFSGTLSHIASETISHFKLFTNLAATQQIFARRVYIHSVCLQIFKVQCTMQALRIPSYVSAQRRPLTET